MDEQERQRSGDEARRAHLNGEEGKMNTVLRPEVEAHLAEEAASPEELHELRAATALLGALPQVAPRRTFILTPEQVAAAGGPRVKQRRLVWVWPTRWATAIAAVCFAVTIGLDMGTAPEVTPVTAPSPTVAAAAVVPTATPQAAAASADPSQLTILGSPSTVEPAATAVPSALPPKPPVPTPEVRTDWRPTQIALGTLTAIGAFFGFLLPPFLRRRGMATA